MVYSDKYEFIFYAVPKVGSRSIQEHLQNYGKRSKTGWIPNHNNYEEVKKDIGEEKSEKYFKFAFFRDPRSLLISIFYYNRHRLHLPPDKQTVIEWLNTYQGGDPYIPYIFDKRGRVILDFIGRLEHIDEDFKRVCNMINIPPPEKISHTGAQNVKGRVSFMEYYESPVLSKKIRDFFVKSLSVLEYDI